MASVAHALDRRLGGADEAGDLRIGQFRVVAQQPGDGVRAVLAARDRRVAGPRARRHRRQFVFAFRDLQPQIRVLLAALDLGAGQMARGDRVHALDPLGHIAIGDALHFKNVKTAEIRHLVKGERGVFDEPDGRRLGHKGLNHVASSGPPGEPAG